MLLSVGSMWLAWRSLVSGTLPTPAGPDSVVFRGLWDGLTMLPTLSCLASFACIAAVALMMVMVNKQFNLLRTMSVFFAAFFVVATCATPSVASWFGSGSLLALVVMGCMWMMYGIYSERDCTRRLCLIFALLTAAATIDYHFLLYLPVFIIGMGQMRIFRFKTALAALLGILAPPWIVYGLGLAPLPAMPRIFWTPPSAILTLAGGVPFVVTVGYTLLLGVSMWVLNLFRILSFNARARAYNGLLLLIGVATGIYAVINFTYLPFYVTLLNACVAFQVGLFFRYSASRRGYIFVLSMLAGYVGLYIWQTV